MPRSHIWIGLDVGRHLRHHHGLDLAIGPMHVQLWLTVTQTVTLGVGTTSWWVRCVGLPWHRGPMRYFVAPTFDAFLCQELSDLRLYKTKQLQQHC